MITTNLQDLFGSKAAEAVLLALFHQGEAYGRAIARDFDLPVLTVQRQLERFERADALICKQHWRTLLYSWNPSSRMASRLKDLVAVAYDSLSPKLKQELFTVRHQLHTNDKSVIRQ